MKNIIHADNAPRAIGPYSQAIEAGGFVFVSGQIPLDPMTGAVIAGSIAEQTRQIMANARAVLSAAGCGFEQVVKTTIYLTNMDDFAVVNDVYGAYFPESPPARATVAVSQLPKNVSIEMDFIAFRS